MKRIKLISLVLSLLFVFACMGIVFAQAETVPTETQPVVTDPVASEVITEPTVPSGTGTDVTDPTGTGATDPTATGTTDVTEPETQRPTEYDEPSTFSDYVSPAPIYTPGDQDYEKQDWNNLSLNLDNVNNSGGPGSFAGIKNDRSNRDRTNPVWIILCIVFWCMSLAAVTLAILYRPQKVKSKAVASTKDRAVSDRRNSSRTSRTPSPRYERKYSDDYNDGY